jgi:hypothetical protein
MTDGIQEVFKFPRDGRKRMYCSDPYSQTPLFTSIFNRLCFEAETVASSFGQRETSVDHLLQVTFQLDRILYKLDPTFIENRGNALEKRFHDREFTSDGFLVYTFKRKMTKNCREVLLGYLDLVLEIVKKKKQVLQEICSQFSGMVIVQALKLMSEVKNYEYNFIFGVLKGCLQLSLQQIADSPSLGAKEVNGDAKDSTGKENEPHSKVPFNTVEGVRIGRAISLLAPRDAVWWLYLLSVEVTRGFCSFLFSVFSSRLDFMDLQAEYTEHEEDLQDPKEDEPGTPHVTTEPEIRIPKPGKVKTSFLFSLEQLIPAFFGRNLGEKLLDVVIDEEYCSQAVEDLKDIRLFWESEPIPRLGKKVIRILIGLFIFCCEVIFETRKYEFQTVSDFSDCLRKVGSLIYTEEDSSDGEAPDLEEDTAKVTSKEQEKEEKEETEETKEQKVEEPRAPSPIELTGVIPEPDA